MAGPAPEFIELMAIIRSYQQSRAVTVAAQLGIADLLRDGSRSVDELAASTATHTETLYRLMRALAAIGVFREDAGRSFSLTAMGEYLRTDVPLSLSMASQMFGADYGWKAWGELPHSVRTGENSARHALGEDMWAYLRQHPHDSEIFNASMRTMSRSNAPAEVAAYDFGRHKLIADIAGGTGAMLATILAQHPGVRGILFDQPQVVAEAAQVLQDAGVADRVTIEAGSFFERVPSGPDLYILRRILHDWMDPECTRILRCIREAMTPDARLVVIDCVVGPPNEDPLAKFLDLTMLVLVEGKERTESEWTGAARGRRLPPGAGDQRDGKQRHHRSGARVGQPRPLSPRTCALRNKYRERAATGQRVAN